jgi:hypothetical protein
MRSASVLWKTVTKRILRLLHSMVNFNRTILPQTMKRKFVRILFVVLATFAVFSFAYPDDLSDDDSSCSQIEMLHVSPVRIRSHRDQQGLAVDSPRLFATNKSTCSLSSSETTTPPTLLSLAACVLRC